MVYLIARMLRAHSVTKSCLTLCDPTDCSPPGSSVRGISQARILECVAFPSPGDLPDPGMESVFPALAGDSLPLSHLGSPFTGQEDLKGQLVFEARVHLKLVISVDEGGLGMEVLSPSAALFDDLPFCHCGQDQDCKWQPCKQIPFLQSLTRPCPPRSVAEAALPAATLPSWQKQELLSRFYLGVFKCPSETSHWERETAEERQEENHTYTWRTASSKSTRSITVLTSLWFSRASTRVWVRSSHDWTGMYLGSPIPCAKWQYTFRLRVCSTVSSRSW